MIRALRNIMRRFSRAHSIIIDPHTIAYLHGAGVVIRYERERPAE